MSSRSYLERYYHIYIQKCHLEQGGRKSYEIRRRKLQGSTGSRKEKKNSQEPKPRMLPGRQCGTALWYGDFCHPDFPSFRPCHSWLKDEDWGILSGSVRGQSLTVHLPGRDGCIRRRWTVQRAHQLRILIKPCGFEAWAASWRCFPGTARQSQQRRLFLKYPE